MKKELKLAYFIMVREAKLISYNNFDECVNYSVVLYNSYGIRELNNILGTLLRLNHGPATRHYKY